MFCTPVFDNFAVTTTVTLTSPLPVEGETLLIERETNNDDLIDVMEFFPCIDDTIDDEFYDSHVDLFSLLSADIQHDLCRSKDIFHDCLDVTSTLIKGCHFYDARNEYDHGLVAPHWFRSEDEFYLWTLIKLPLFCLTMLFWDTLTYLLVHLFQSSNNAPFNKSYASSNRSTRLTFYPKKWMIFTSSIMLLHSVFQGHLPTFPLVLPSFDQLTIIQAPLRSYKNIKDIDQLVCLNFDTLRQFNRIKATQLIQDLETYVDRSSSKLSTTELDNFFDSYSEIPVNKLHWFHCRTDLDTSNTPTSTNFDPFCFDTITSKRFVVNCHNDAASDLFKPESNIAPSFNAHTHLLRPDAFLSFKQSRHPIIFDTGASLAITFDKNDFEGPIQSPNRPMKLGGMANGLEIEGIGTVAWGFTAADGSEIVLRTQCYYVPRANARLLSPQRLLNKAKGVKGTYSGDESTFSLNIDDCPSLCMSYDERSNLPIGYATTDCVTTPQVHFSILDDQNQNLTLGQKLLLEWHYRLGHMNFPHVQWILRCFPFVAVKFHSASKCDVSSLKCETCEFAKAY